MKFLNPALMFVLIAGVSVAAVGCTEDSTDDDATIDNTTIVARDNQTRTGASCSTDTVAFLKKGIISCDGDSVNPQCKECGNGGTHDCCLERLGPDWVCDYVCTNWIYPDPRDHTKKYCK